ncbi:uncharacterized protein JCM15063_000423 [Sporobolomyces koalae]|uniref:uncharacterized protein n=1 Tax=Sporobolomyces koalae TaxID=500713 RepID=UPI00316FDA29
MYRPETESQKRPAPSTPDVARKRARDQENDHSLNTQEVTFQSTEEASAAAPDETDQISRTGRDAFVDEYSHVNAIAGPSSSQANSLHSTPTQSVDRLEEEDQLATQGQTEGELLLDQRTREQYVAIEFSHTDLLQQSTINAYAACVQEYVEHWETYNAIDENQQIPPYPIVASKVFEFMRATASRPLRGRGNDIEGTQLGVGSLKKYVSALERERSMTSAKFPDNLAAQTKLRDDDRIKCLERKWDQDSKQSQQKSQASKSARGLSERITDDERKRIFGRLFSTSETPGHYANDLRDMAMLMFGCSSSMRGDRIRATQHSDLGLHLHEFANPEIPRVPTLIKLSNSGKTDACGPLDQNGIWRHRDPELCGFFAVALHLWSTYHLVGRTPPDFTPEFSSETVAEGYGKYGRKRWYDRVVFTGSMNKSGVSLDRPLSYDAHITAVKKVFEAVGIKKNHSAHASRATAAPIATHNDASEAVTAADGSFRACYQLELPIPTIAGLAGFDASAPKEYFIARAHVLVPEELAKLLFPWVERARTEYQARLYQDRRHIDLALERHLDLLEYCRQCILQDLASLRATHPMPQYIETDHALGTQGLPDVVRDAIERSSRHQIALVHQVRDTMITSFDAMRVDLDERMTEISNGSSGSRRRQKNSDPLDEQGRLSELEQKLDGMSSQLNGMTSQLNALCSFLGMGVLSPASTPGSAPGPVPPPCMLPPRVPPPRMLPTHLPSALSMQTPHDSRANVPAPQASISSISQPSLGLMPGTSVARRPVQVATMPPLTPPVPVPTRGTPALIMARSTNCPDGRCAEMARLLEQFGDRISSLVFQWHAPRGGTGRSKAHSGKWVPVDYNFARAISVRDYIEENERGLKGGLSIQELETVWGTSWRPSPAAATAMSRRRAILSAVAMIREHRKWDQETAVRFLETTYQTGRRVADLYGKSDQSGKEQLIAESARFVP